MSTTTTDGVLLAGVYLPGPAGLTFVVAHGMTHSTAEDSTRQVIAGLARRGSVLALDFRGHGESEGRSSVGRDEPLDVAAALTLARRLAAGEPVVLVGFSMGAAAVLVQAGAGAASAVADTADTADTADAVVAVSPAARWYIRETTQMRRVHWLLEHPLGPLVGRWVGVRLSDPWDAVPVSPIEVMAQITAPLLLVHGTADRYFSPAHAISLQRASNGGAELWIEPGMGHAESGTSAQLLGRIADWAAAAVRDQPRPA
ncbi:MAG: alpha/beta hydrolase family protein [Nakamurella sp.]